ncbi:MAG: EamA family transporter [Actinomycetota bacterium]|nr:EamA family transporter [Actinomycetota bacterium]
MEGSTRPAGGFVLAAFALAVTLGGANFLAVRFSNRELAPLWGAGLRFSLAAALFVVIAVILRLRWPRGRQLWVTVVYGLLGFALFYALMYWALVRVTAGVATVVLAVVPLVTLLLATAHRLERLQRRALIGALLALVGLGWMAVGPREVVLPLPALLAMVAAAICVGESVVVAKRLSGNHPVMTNAVAMVTGAAALLAMSAVAGEDWVLPRQPEVVWSVAYLVTLGSVGLFVLALLVVRHWTASATSYMFVLFPVVTMLLGAWLADEVVTVHGVVGALLVGAGVWFGAVSPAARRASAITPPQAPPTVPSRSGATT